MRSRLGLPAEAGDLAASTIHEFRYALAHGSAPTDRPPFRSVLRRVLERGSSSAAVKMPARPDAVKNK
jgi:hypothetical protein